MKINSLIFNNKQEGWNFDEISFSDLSLLVGISGVGKTQILRAIMLLKNTVNGEAEPGVYWKINFTTVNKDNYIWEGELTQIEKTDEELIFVTNEETKEKPTFIFERLWLNDELIVDRNTESIIYEKKTLPKLDINETVIKILKEENIKNAFSGFNKIIFRDHTEKARSYRFFDSTDFERLKSKYDTVEKIREAEIDIVRKLAVLQEVSGELFKEIESKFCDIFQQVEKIKIEKNDSTISFYNVKLKILDTEKWVNQNSISSGMLRTLMHIAEMYLCEDGTVFLIDEFENSLGVNCVNVLSEDLILENQRMQFIVTSHHPYIINKIPCAFWKIVTRQGSTIKVYDATNFDLAESPHENFFKLINLKQYKNGITL